jgi:hypothetical protein
MIFFTVLFLLWRPYPAACGWGGGNYTAQTQAEEIKTFVI